MYCLVGLVWVGIYVQCTGIGRKIETDYHVKYSFKSFRDIPDLVSDTPAVYNRKLLSYTEKCKSKDVPSFL